MSLWRWTDQIASVVMNTMPATSTAPPITTHVPVWPEHSSCLCLDNDWWEQIPHMDWLAVFLWVSVLVQVPLALLSWLCLRMCYGRRVVFVREITAKGKVASAPQNQRSRSCSCAWFLLLGPLPLLLVVAGLMGPCMLVRDEMIPLSSQASMCFSSIFAA